jgi:hypothetical protein
VGQEQVAPEARPSHATEPRGKAPRERRSAAVLRRLTYAPDATKNFTYKAAEADQHPTWVGAKRKSTVDGLPPRL